ncbi:branched-chain amino acid transport system permease protein [Leptothrix sp. C29]|uniref:Branched-chain amino acid transport system permease protein n=2 Tax=Sphaerotilus uruguayifluvii TaxID=2735897 RepID=A0ABX2G3S9_9BURK|nr:branched-chain amino acid ABC transporter permease [Leptothrix sp. C29]NRT56108.1 branched-chain amino acid transport system permease protein [Leptothrix sp. C29]
MAVVSLPRTRSSDRPARPSASPSRPPRSFRFRPWNLGRWLTWGGFALVLLLAPLLWRSSFALTMLSQMGIAIIVCLSYNLLLGQGGMLSFGHAVYSGLGAYAAIHTLNQVGAGTLALPVSLVPLVGGLGGLACAALFGLASTRKSGTTFAMITLGLGELVWSMSLMLPEFFGGEGGISSNRVVGAPVLGITFGPQIQLYYLIALYCFVCTALMFAFTRTPLGRMLNAVRDNAERVEFVGYSARHIRWLAFMVAGFFAGVGGGLGALNFEIVTAEVVSAHRSGAYLLFVFLGGATFFFGPILGAVLMVIALVLLSEWTRAWLLYLGLVFMFMVTSAPGGLASLIMMNLRVAAFGRLRPLRAAWIGLAGTALAALAGLAGLAAMIEMLYHRQLDAAMGSELRFLGLTLDSASPDAWTGAVLVLLTGAGLFELARRQFRRQWDETQEAIEKDIRRRETAT